MTSLAVQPGEAVLMFHDARSTYLSTYKPGGHFECHHGRLTFPEVLEWGAVLPTNRGVPIAVLRPTHGEVMTMLKRRTTVVYPKEAGKIVMELGVRAGGRYAECGSGSGAMTTILAHLVGPGGKVYSFEREETHQEQARVNLKRMGLADRVEFTLTDPARYGFGLTGLDGIFIDVPEPWSLAEAGAEAAAGGALGQPLTDRRSGRPDRTGAVRRRLRHAAHGRNDGARMEGIPRPDAARRPHGRPYRLPALRPQGPRPAILEVGSRHSRPLNDRRSTGRR